MSRRRRITSKGRELIKKRSYYDRYTLRSCRPKFSKKGTRRNTYCLLRRSKSRKRRSKSKKRRSKRDGMDDEEGYKIYFANEEKNLRKSYMEDDDDDDDDDIDTKKTKKTSNSRKSSMKSSRKKSRRRKSKKKTNSEK